MVVVDCKVPCASRHPIDMPAPPSAHTPTDTSPPGRTGTRSCEPCAVPGYTWDDPEWSTVAATLPSGSCTRPAPVAESGVTSNEDAWGDSRFPTTASSGYQPYGPRPRSTASSAETSPLPPPDATSVHARHPPA